MKIGRKLTRIGIAELNLQNKHNKQEPELI